MAKNSFSVFDYCALKKLPSHDELYSLLEQAVSVLEKENKDLRPYTSDGSVGSLIELNSENSSIVVPDIHARPKFIQNILNFSFPKKTDFCAQDKEAINLPTVYELLEQNKINIVCVGDAFHTEKTYERWQEINKEFLEDNFTGPNMTQEMTECFASFCALLKLKVSFPNQFFFIKGNHENVLNSSCNGDRAFYKYAQEGEMVKLFINQYYGEDILYLISMYESLLPLVVKLPNAIVSHAEPSLVLNREQIINAKENSKFVYSLIWTKNGDVIEDTANKIIQFMYQDLSLKEQKNILYFTGHRPVKNVYQTRQNGKIIQIHNPEQQNIALVSAKRKFKLTKDFYNVENIGGKK